MENSFSIFFQNFLLHMEIDVKESSAAEYQKGRLPIKDIFMVEQTSQKAWETAQQEYSISHAKLKQNQIKRAFNSKFSDKIEIIHQQSAGNYQPLSINTQKAIHSLTSTDYYSLIIKFITMDMSWISTILLLAIASSAATVKYHQRRLYYNDQDYCCLGNQEHDYINLVATFDDRPKITQLIRGGTSCYPYTIKDVDRITPSDFMNYYKCFYDEQEYCDTIKLSQKLTTTRVGLKVTSLVQRATMSNPAKIDQKEYHCEIEGDGNLEHFGPFGSIPAPTIYLTCNHIKANLQIEASS